MVRAKLSTTETGFDRVDTALKSSNVTVGADEGIGAYAKNSGYSPTVRSAIVMMIDSLQENYRIGQYHNVSAADGNFLQVGEMKLLDSIVLYNENLWDFMDSAIPDTIDYWDESASFSKQKWFTFYFIDKTAEEKITYLNYIKYQILNEN